LSNFPKIEQKIYIFDISYFKDFQQIADIY